MQTETHPQKLPEIWQKERRAASVFWLLLFRIMHVMRNLGKQKIPISRIFGVSAPAGSFLGLIQPLCTFCTFYHVLLFYLSRTFRCFPCYALLHFVLAILFRQASLCACFITFHVTAMVVQLLLCRHYFACFYQIVSYVWMLTAYNVNYKDLWL